MQITKEQYLRDVEAVREELYFFSSSRNQIKSLQEEINRDYEAAETPTFAQKFRVWICYFVALIVLWNGADFLADITQKPNGEMAAIPSIIAFAVIAYAVYVGYLWFRPQSAYKVSSLYRKEIARIQEKEEELHALQEKKNEAGQKVGSRFYYLPKEYMTDVDVLEIETYMKRYGANTLDEAIAAIEKKRKR